MTNLITKIKTIVAQAAIYAAALLMLGLGFAFVGTIALFGLVAVAITMIAALFVAPAVPAPADAPKSA